MSLSRFERFTLALVAGLALANPLQAATDSEAFKAIYEKEWEFRTREFPLLASSVGIEDYADQLAHVTEADYARRYQYWKDVREALNAISCERLEASECVNYRVYIAQIENFLTEYETNAYLIPFTSDTGFYTAWTWIPKNTEFRTIQDYRDYLARLHHMPRAMNDYIALMRKGVAMGFTQPRVILDGRDEPIKAQLVDDVKDSAFFAPFLELPESVAGGERTVLLATAEKVISEDVLPAWQNLYDFYHQEYVPGARETLGAIDLPGGPEYYQGRIKQDATVDMTPDQIHQIGLEQVARIRAEMEEIIKQVEFEGSFADFIEFLRTDPQFYAKTPKELLSFASYYAKKIDGRMPSMFGRLPRQPYGVAPVPKEIAPYYTAGRYVDAPLEARRGGYYWVNTHALESRPLYAIPALTLHEGAPGHHTQNALAKEQKDQPPFRRYDYISAYGEGWGLYAEKLGVEMDIYETPYEHFGRLTYEMWRACRLVIDTGIHAKGWGRQQAIDYLASNTALSMHEVTTEIDRYISWPGQALSYKLGEYTLWQLRDHAEQALGDQFDVRAFHDFVLGLGSVPLDVLSDQVNAWVSSQQ